MTSLHAQCCLYQLAGAGEDEMSASEIQDLFIKATKLDAMQPGLVLGVAHVARACLLFVLQ